MINTYKWPLYHWHVELSSRCALKCPRCPRTEDPLRPGRNQDISLETFIKTFSSDFINKYVQRFTLCGNDGDPIYNKDFLRIVKYIKDSKPSSNIVIITNGSYRSKAWWSELADILNENDSVHFSIDGYDSDSNNQYRVNSDWDSIIAGLDIMTKSSAIVYWAAIYFQFNQKYQDKIKSLAREHGCDAVRWTKSTKFNHVYKNQFGEKDTLQPVTELISNTHRYERTLVQLSENTVRSAAFLKKNLFYFHIAPQCNAVKPLCMIGQQGLYLSSTGNFSPCCWLNLSNKDLNIHQKSLEDILNDPYWSHFMDTWNTVPHTICQLKCNKTVTTPEYCIGYDTN